MLLVVQRRRLPKATGCAIDDADDEMHDKSAEDALGGGSNRNRHHAE